MFKAVILLKRLEATDHQEFLGQLNIHLRPLLTSVEGLNRVVVSDAIAGPGGKPAYDAIAEFWFDDLESVEELVNSETASAAEHAMAAFVDMRAYETFLTIEHEVSADPAHA